MSRVRILAAFLLVIMLAVLLCGLSMQGTYLVPQNRHELVSTQAFAMPANATTYKTVNLDKIGAYYLTVYIEGEDGTVFSNSLSNESLQKWLVGQFNVSWDGTSNSGNMFGLQGPCKTHYAEVTNDSGPVVQNVVFWNPETYQQGVHLSVYREWSETDQASYNLGIQLSIIGAAGILAVAAFFAVKNRQQIRNNITPKKALTLIICLVLIFSGTYTAYTYSNPVEAKITLLQGTLNVPANGTNSVVFEENRDGVYIIYVSTTEGPILGYTHSSPTLVDYWPNGTEIPLMPNFNGTSGRFGWMAEISDPFNEYLIFSNPDATNKDVNYQVTCQWTYNNYFAMMAGITIAIVGAIGFFLTLCRNKLRDFNRVLENESRGFR